MLDAGGCPVQAQILEFTQTRGLPAALVPELEQLFAQLAHRGVVSGQPATVDGLVEERSAVDLTGAAPDSGVPRGARIAGRYEDVGPLGAGGMAEVRRVRDVELNRTLAMKIIHAGLLQKSSALVRFLDEAQATAQLQHPSIVPVHDIGTLPDGRIWFTMKEVQGSTLSDVVTDVHAASSYRWETGVRGFTFRRMVNAFLSVCRAVGYAHERGVVHRDLKPSNVMIGALGEVYVLDWGLAKIVGRADLAAEEGALDVVQTSRGSSDDHRTEHGRVVGTPAYMPPEQARGDVDRIDARSDVYALGAMLYEILSGEAPYPGRRADQVLRQVLSGPPVPVGLAAPSMTVGPGSSLGLDSGRAGPPLPTELVAACERAMEREPGDRFASALDLAAEVEAWLDGARRREQALEVVRQALGQVAHANALVKRAAALRAESEALLADVPSWAPEDDKAPGWARAAEAEAEERRALLQQLEVDQGLHGALQIAPELEEAHAALAERYRVRHEEAEAARDREGMARAELRVRSHVAALSEAHFARRACATYLKGDGALTLVTDPPGAEVQLYRYEERNRRLVEVAERSLGSTPLRTVSLPMGSYVCVLHREGHAPVRYPVEVPRLGHWDGVRPGDPEPHPVWLPPAGELGDSEVYVPAGWFRSGADRYAPNSHPARRPWCHGLVVQRFPVTQREYIAFLDDLVAQGREEEALRHAPRERAGREGELGALLYGRTASGGFAMQTDADGDTWQPDWPVIHVDWVGARAYLAWLAERSGRPWRLPGELEWEKAARGVDGRWYPWGDHLDPSWCCMTASHVGRKLPADVDTYPVDISPYGVRGMGGNMRDWCLDTDGSVVDDVVAVPDAGDTGGRSLRVVRGGAWDLGARSCGIPSRGLFVPSLRIPLIGFRGVVAWTGAPVAR